MDLASSLKYNKREKPRTVDSIDRIPRKKRKQTNKNIGYLCDGDGSDSDHDNHSFFSFERKKNTKSHRSGDSNFVKMKCVSNRLWAVRRSSCSHQVFNYEGLRFAVWISIAMCVCAHMHFLFSTPMHSLSFPPSKPKMNIKLRKKGKCHHHIGKANKKKNYWATITNKWHGFTAVAVAVVVFFFLVCMRFVLFSSPMNIVCVDESFD